MRQVFVIAKQTFREAVRNKILLVFIFLGLIIICSSVLMPVVGDGREKVKIVESICFRSITFFGTFAAILLSASSIPTDIDRGALCAVTTKPVQRAKIIFGKIIGYLYIIGVLIIIMGGASYALIRLCALKQGDKINSKLVAKKKYDHYALRIEGESARKIGGVSWIEGGGKGASVWKFKGLYSKEKGDELSVAARFLVESQKKFTGKIPISIKIISPYAGEILTESIEVSRNKPVLLKLDGKSLDKGGELTIVASPENPGDFIGIKPDTLRVFLGENSFGYNYLKGLTIISFQFLLMVIIAVLGSTFLSLPVNILFCLFIFFCGNITDFMRDLSTVMNVFEAREHGISTVMKQSNVFMTFLHYVIKKPILLLSYILPDFRNFSVGSYFIDGISIPCKKVFMGFGHVALYTFFCLPISLVIFKRREIT